MQRSSIRYTAFCFTMACITLLAVPFCSTQAGVLVANKLNPANGHLYSLLDTATWTASEAEAIALGGHLVTINDAASATKFADLDA